MECVPTKYKIAELVSAWRDGSLKINEEYQRGAAWTTSQMQALVDSVFRSIQFYRSSFTKSKLVALGEKRQFDFRSSTGSSASVR